MKEDPVIAPEIGSAQRRLAMRTVADPQRKLLYVNLWGEVGTQDEQRFRTLVTPYVRAGYLLYRVTISSLGGSVEAAMDIGEQIRTLRSEVRAPYRDKQGDPHYVFRQATQDKVRAGDDGLADPDGFACRCASACSFIWASGFRRDGDVIGVHMFIFVDDAAARWSPRELRRQTARSVRELNRFPAKMGIPASIRASLVNAAGHDLRPYPCRDHDHDKGDGFLHHAPGKLQNRDRSAASMGAAHPNERSGAIGL